MSALIRSGTFSKALGVAFLAAVAAYVPAAQAQDASQSSVEVYTNQALPTTPPPGVQPNMPLKPGQMTLQDVLAAHPAPTTPPPVPATAPVLAPNANASSEKIMLMEGMQNALQERGNGQPSRLQPPQMQSGIAPALQPVAASGVAQQASTPASTSVPAAPVSNVVYQPRQAPKDLAASAPAQPEAATETASASTPATSPTPAIPASSSSTSSSTSVAEMPEVPKATDIEQPPTSLDEASSASSASSSNESAAAAETPAPAPAPPSTPSDNGGNINAAQAMREAAAEQAPAPEPPSTPAASAPTAAAASTKTAANCTPNVESWTKTCAEAGYPASYIGKITGETRTICPQGDLQDVWTENSCTPPPDNAAAAPTPAPAAVAQTAPPSSTPSSESAPPAPIVTVSAADVMPATESPPMPAEKPTQTAQVAVPNTEEPAIAGETASSVSVDASCGPANGLAAGSKPATDLCIAGGPTEVTGDGPWHWDCNGINGGLTVSCAAPAKTPAGSEAAAPTIAEPVLAPPTTSSTRQDGSCGMANGMGMEQAPVADLCVNGTPSRVNGGGPWTWACSGFNGGKAAACIAPKKIAGTCGSASGASASKMPSANLCASGSASAVTGDGPWNWTCSGLHGGDAATCSAQTKKAGVCGSATVGGHKETPSDNLCSVGTASAVAGTGPWNWACEGTDGGASVNCAAKSSVNGSCGAANGVATSKAPMENTLCSAGKPSRVTGSGPWNWSCAGLEGGETESCTASSTSEEKAEENPSAPVAAAAPEAAAVEGLCGTAANVPSAQEPADNLCAGGVAGKIKSEKSGWVWNCEGSSENASVSCSAPHVKMDVVANAAPAAEQAAGNAPASGSSCGAAAGQGSLQAPAADLCSVGKPTIVRGKGPWHWVCIKGKDKAACEAPKQVDAACGPANGSMQKAVPAKGLCTSGTPTEVAGQGPWLWTCVGAGGGNSTSCSAAVQSVQRIDGACGASANTTVEMAPSANLCEGGTPSNVYGEGPWTWTCSGSNGGVAASCTARREVPSAPPPPAQAVNGLCGAANGVAGVDQPREGLCSAGTVTAVSGDGPWNWNCLGQNGGMTVSCTAPLMPPAPVTGECGGASGQPTLTTPQSGLCAAGISSAVSGQGPWTWSCSGTNGGGAVGCVAPLATSGGGPLPSIVTPARSVPGQTPLPAKPAAALVTPKLPTGPLPPLETGSMPPSKPFPPAPEGQSAPSETAADVSPVMNPPSAAPQLPVDTSPLEPPPVRDTLQPSPALKPPAIDGEGKVVPGNRFVLADDLSTMPFVHGTENIGNDETPVLDRLVAVLKAHSDVRITLTAYAGLDPNSSPRDARRLSLARALAIRDYLTAKGVASGRIDVRALGANVVTGEADRVDIRAN
jgi:outer membrane protein OmpA-like peptidoglycan-associated protein